jgi:cytochrome c oxidase assembly protein subunit 11
MPVTFFVDPELLKDPEGQFVKEITLSYTFHETPLPETASNADQAALAVPASGAVN